MFLGSQSLWRGWKVWLSFKYIWIFYFSLMHCFWMFIFIIGIKSLLTYSTFNFFSRFSTTFFSHYFVQNNLIISQSNYLLINRFLLFFSSIIATKNISFSLSRLTLKYVRSARCLMKMTLSHWKFLITTSYIRFQIQNEHSTFLEGFLI